ncbi:MAG: response regulator [Anaerolineae bacterium]|jgi:CheY-like chemotaxis protein|nr:response regulator [Anaerolineae bacterium]
MTWRILVVEDEFDSIQVVSRILQHHGVAVEVAHNGHEALAALDHSLPTLVIMDLALPEMDGWETLKKIRDNPRLAHLPVVAITAYHSVNVAEDALHAGFDAYLPKPLDTGALMQQLAGVLKS